MISCRKAGANLFAPTGRGCAEPCEAQPPPGGSCASYRQLNLWAVISYRSSASRVYGRINSPLQG
ncbi:hypothetical protein THIOKS13020025 [Thiocapsa sp. KS1]|nr:hypothetical protein THIOKS13020025 [Thiocapsa sp. KS1]